jgi:hypothetical protein
LAVTMSLPVIARHEAICELHHKLDCYYNVSSSYHAEAGGISPCTNMLQALSIDCFVRRNDRRVVK